MKQFIRLFFAMLVLSLPIMAIIEFFLAIIGNINGIGFKMEMTGFGLTAIGFAAFILFLGGNVFFVALNAAKIPTMTEEKMLKRAFVKSAALQCAAYVLLLLTGTLLTDATLPLDLGMLILFPGIFFVEIVNKNLFLGFVLSFLSYSLTILASNLIFYKKAVIKLEESHRNADVNEQEAPQGDSDALSDTGNTQEKEVPF